MRQSRLIDQAQRHLRAHLPEEMREYIFVGGFSNGRLTLISGQASWLTWLRYEQSQLLSLLHQLPGFEGVTGFTLKVRPVRPIESPKRYTRTLSDDTGKTLAECAKDTDNPALKKRPGAACFSRALYRTKTLATRPLKRIKHRLSDPM